MRAFSPALPPASHSRASSTPAAPVFTTQPSNQTVVDGATVTFTSLASGYPAPTYQWYKWDGSTLDGNADPVYVAIGGATSRILSFAAALADDGYVYRCTATNSEGSANSSAATLTVTAAVGGYRSYLGWYYSGYAEGVFGEL